MSISPYASDLSAASHPHSCEIIQSTPSRQSGMVQPVVNEMFATVHAAGSSLLGLFTSCTTFDSTHQRQGLPLQTLQPPQVRATQPTFGTGIRSWEGVHRGTTIPQAPPSLGICGQGDSYN
eukprot:scaffold28066_cov119-Isochrysis_galbana.AAC.3